VIDEHALFIFLLFSIRCLRIVNFFLRTWVRNNLQWRSLKEAKLGVAPPPLPLTTYESLKTLVVQEGKTRTVICRERRKDRPYEVVLVQQA
jgi:hypothetical protein